MHTLILTLAFVLASPGPSPDRADLLRRFDAARARLASADLATLERAVLMLERASSGGDPDGGHRGDAGRRRGGDHADCVAREVARFKKDGYADTTSADRANEACQGVDSAFLGALVDVLTRDGYSLTTSVSRAREYATDARVARKGLAFMMFFGVFHDDGYSVTTSMERARELLGGLDEEQAECAMRLWPGLRSGNTVSYTLTLAKRACGAR